jgi:hypothetical protein
MKLRLTPRATADLIELPIAFRSAIQQQRDG